MPSDRLESNYCMHQSVRPVTGLADASRAPARPAGDAGVRRQVDGPARKRPKNSPPYALLRPRLIVPNNPAGGRPLGPALPLAWISTDRNSPNASGVPVAAVA